MTCNNATPTSSQRAALPSDAAFIYELRKAGLRTYVEHLWGWDEAEQIARFQAHFDPSRYQVVVVASGDVGAICVEWGTDQVFLADIAILPDWRGRGLGTALITAVLQEAQQREIPVALQVLKGNPARQLYERLGFRVVAATPSHDRMRTGKEAQ